MVVFMRHQVLIPNVPSGRTAAYARQSASRRLIASGYFHLLASHRLEPCGLAVAARIVRRDRWERAIQRLRSRHRRSERASGAVRALEVSDPLTKDQPVATLALTGPARCPDKNLGAGDVSCFMTFRDAEVNAPADPNCILLNERSAGETVRVVEVSLTAAGEHVSVDIGAGRFALEDQHHPEASCPQAGPEPGVELDDVIFARASVRAGRSSGGSGLATGEQWSLPRSLFLWAILWNACAIFTTRYVASSAESTAT